ncbi:MAG: tetratricopeptide repeat protein [Burkholderiales bacterium]|nr:tetratricopeptide repeat protein [Phycisphaerae bacterium]
MNHRLRTLSWSASLATAVGVSLLGAGCATESTSGPTSAGSPTRINSASNSASNSGISATPALNQYVQGYRAYRRGDAEGARATLESAVQSNPDLLMARAILGEIYRKNNDFSSAARQYEVLTKTDPYTLNNHYYLGVSYQFLQRFRESAVAYLRGLEIDPNDFRSNMNVGTVYLALGELDKATKYLDHATQIDPSSAVAWSNLGVALDARNSLVLAETSYRKAIERSPGSQAIVQNLANNLLAQKKTGEAIYLWEQIVEKNPTSFTQTKLAEAHTQGGDFPKAMARLDAVLTADPRYVPALNARAAAYIRQYELSGFSQDNLRVQAVDSLTKSLALNSGQTTISEQLNKWKSASAIGR